MKVEHLRSILMKRGYIKIPANGFSMAPIIRTGDICEFLPIQEHKDLRHGHILLFMSKMGYLVGHRLIRTIVHDGEVLYICKGDSNLSADAPITAAEIVGKMSAIEHRGVQKKTDSFLLKIWGAIIVRFAFVSVCNHYGMRGIRKIKRIVRG